MIKAIDIESPNFIAAMQQIFLGYEELADFIKCSGSPSVYSDLSKCVANLSTGIMMLAEQSGMEDSNGYRYAMMADDQMKEEFYPYEDIA